MVDTIFINDFKKFDIIVGMYHDQVAPFKLYLNLMQLINIRLNYLRVSPDHGTAKKLIGKKELIILAF